jgi:hypothetical protein
MCGSHPSVQPIMHEPQLLVLLLHDILGPPPIGGVHLARGGPPPSIITLEAP